MYCMSCITSAAEKESSSSSSSSSGKKCAWTENGVSACDSKAASGSKFCSYHQELIDLYLDITGG